MTGKILAAVAGALLGVLGGLTLVLATSPMIEVRIASGSRHATIQVPIRLAPVALRFVPDSALAEARRELAPIYPALATVVDELAKLDSGVLVEVQEPDTFVRVSKENDLLTVDITDHGERIVLRVPVKELAPLLYFLDSK
ncbi:MAG TPA: hypothetical protein P5568_08370 [Acidobacteriota bacterium]|nr:hypothetical protein [Acidobacteriota bacterium]HRV08468.1 hypothetical protein [Acidobacteriota bacterium]